MSINVTVSGNPIRINRGKMVTSADSVKNEFEKRRLIRLEQVRQQSKDIAETVRNKLKKEKTKCLLGIEKDGEIKLKNWQARKLLELQNQYQQAIDELGLGHKDVIEIEDEMENFVKLQESNEAIAKERGRVASEWVQIEKNDHEKKAKTKENIAPIQNTKKRKPPTKKVKKKESFDSDGENRVPQLTLEQLYEISSDSSEREEITRKRTGVLPRRKEQTTSQISREQQTSAFEFQVPTSEKAAQTINLLENEPPLTAPATREYPLDTRISERIKRRTKLDYCDVEETLPSTTIFCNCCRNCVKHHDEKGFETEVNHHIEKSGPVENNVPVQNNSNKEKFQNYPTERPFLEDSDNLRNNYEHTTNTQRHIDIPVASTTEKNTHKTPEERSTSMPEKIDGQRRTVPFQKPTTVPMPQKVDKKTIPPSQKYVNRTALQTYPIPQKYDDGKSTSVSQKNENLRITEKYDDPRLDSIPKSNLPSKPKVTLKSTKGRPVYIEPDNIQPVQYYDHPNRFEKTYVPPNSHVQRIDDEEVLISPNILSEDEIVAKMRQREIEAHRRGQLAIEKEKIQKEYRDLLKQLPVLQKQERIFEIGADKKKYHMSRDRLEDLEKKRQNRLDNAYEELFVRRPLAVVTLPKRPDYEEERQSLNLANWDVDFDKQDRDQTRSDKLNHLLSNLKSQKQSLLKEIENTLSKDTLSQLVKTSSEEIKSKSTDFTRSRRKRSRDERTSSPTDSVGQLDEESSESLAKSKRSTSPAPQKKPKVKPSRKILILQNMSTQTTPRIEVQNVATSPIVTAPTTTVDSCVHRKDSTDDVCEIVIKIKEDEKPEVAVNPAYLGHGVSIVTEAVEKPRVELSKKSTSWRDQLSHTAVSQSTTTTSYMDPPAKHKRVQKKPSKSPEPEQTVNSSASSNGRNSSKQLDARLMTYIKKLLNKSRVSVDELTVSTASEVSTPSHSVIDAPSNNPLQQLMSVMKYFNIDAAELQRQLSHQSDESSKHYNTKETLTVSSSTNSRDETCHVSHTETTCHKKVEESNKKLLEYADIAASCTKKINSLTAMIEKVRAEKKKMLQSSTSSSDKDLTTTSYRDLPDKTCNESEKQSSQKDLEQLLNIDYNYATKLKQLSGEEIESERKRTDVDQPTDEELLNRLKRLLEAKPGEKNVVPESSQTKNVTPKNTSTAIQITEKKFVQESDNGPVGFLSEKKQIESHKNGKTVGAASEKTSVMVKSPQKGNSQEPPPFFLDIPKLPKLELSAEKKTKRPPPSKGLRTIANLVPPHELSTIIEADSQLSTKVDTPSKALVSSSTKPADEPDASGETKSSSDDVSEMETMETMLISIGMEWAIPTLKKTREALAMASSSSGSGTKDSGELSLREFLSKISATSSKSGDASSLSDSQAMSLIQVDHRRTSTPIIENQAKQTGPVFITDSDVSSVRENSEQTIHSEKFIDVNEGSLSKSK